MNPLAAFNLLTRGKIMEGILLAVGGVFVLWLAWEATKNQPKKVAAPLPRGWKAWLKRQEEDFIQSYRNEVRTPIFKNRYQCVATGQKLVERNGQWVPTGIPVTAVGFGASPYASVADCSQRLGKFLEERAGVRKVGTEMTVDWEWVSVPVITDTVEQRRVA